MKTPLELMLKADKMWTRLSEEYKDLANSTVVGLGAAREGFAKKAARTESSKQMKIFSASDYYYKKEDGKATVIENEVAREFGLGGYPVTGDRLVFVNLNDKSYLDDEAVILQTPEIVETEINGKYRFITAGDISEKDALAVLRDFARYKMSFVQKMNSVAKKYIPRRFTDEDKPTKLDLIQNGTINQDIWFMFGNLYARFLRNKIIDLGDKRIEFRNYSNCSTSDAPGFEIDYQTTRDGKNCAKTHGGDVATAQKVVFAVCKSNGISLPKVKLNDVLED